MAENGESEDVPVTDLGWNLNWSDEFDYSGLPDPAKWTYDAGGDRWGNQELQYYTEGRLENARVEDGKLILEADIVAWEGNEYTPARLITKGRGEVPDAATAFHTYTYGNNI